MTEAERAFDAWWDKNGGFSYGPHSHFKDAFLAGWKRERPKAKPLVREEWFQRGCPRLSFDWVIDDWAKENGIPDGTRIRVTIEEVETTQQG